MPGYQIAILVAAFLALDAIIIGSVFYVLGQSLRELSAAFPAHAELPGTPRKHFQSMSLGMLNMGGCVHVAIDGNHLHLYPSLFARWIGMKQVSIPHASLQFTNTTATGRKSKRRGLVSVKIRVPQSTKFFDASLPACSVSAPQQLRPNASEGAAR